MLEWLRELPPEERVRAIEEAWGRVAATEEGKVVIGSLLEELGLLGEIRGPDDVVRHNIAIMVLDRIKRNATTRVLEALVMGGNSGNDTGTGP